MLVKKYANRRLYDTEQSCYITQDELAQRIRYGADPKIIDAKTGVDLTQSVLAQLILDSRGAARLLPTPLLIRLIRLGDDALAEFFGRYISWSLDLYLSARQGAQRMIPVNPFAGAPLDIAQTLGRLFSQYNPNAGPPPPQYAPPPPAPPPPTPQAPASPPAAPPAASTSGDIAALREEIAELRRQMQGDDEAD